MIKQPPVDWYKKIWTLGIKNMSWVEDTLNQVDFIEEVLSLEGNEKILDLACGFGRHSLELARRGYRVIGYDITKAYVDDANESARMNGLNAKFYESDIRDLHLNNEFDVVLNLADGAIGYLENDDENLRIFDVISKALKPGGKSLIDICNKAYAMKNFPQKNWEIGENSISLPWFDFDYKSQRMLYGGCTLVFGEEVKVPDDLNAHSSIRLYDYNEIVTIFKNNGIITQSGYGDYDTTISHDEDHLQMIVMSQKRND
jgi:SAM-dependent methyltransferase